MNEEKELDLQTAKDLFTIETVLNALLDKFENVEATVHSLEETKSLLNELIENVKKNNETMTSLIEKMNENQELNERAEKFRQDNVKLTKQVRELEKKIAKTSENPEVVTKKDEKKEEKKDVEQLALATKKKCEEQKQHMIKDDKTIRSLINCTKEEAKEVFDYLRNCGYIKENFLLDPRASIRKKKVKE